MEKKDLNSKDENGESRLHRASKNSDADEIRFLLEVGADPNIQDDFYKTPLHVAISKGIRGMTEKQKYIVKLLVKHGADVNIKDKNGETCLHRASRNADNVRFLLEEGADPNIQDDFNKFTPLHVAIFTGCCGMTEKQKSVLKLLVEHGADVNIKNRNGETCLHRASRNSNADDIRFLLEEGADPNIQNDFNDTPLHVALSNGNFGTTENQENMNFGMVEKQKNSLTLLVQHGADVNCKGNGGATPLHIASAKNGVQCVEILLENGAKPNIMDDFNETPLHSAAINETKDQEEVVKLLIKHGANVNAKDRNGRTLLHVAAEMANVRIAGILPLYKADSNAQNNDANTPLHCAIDKHTWIYTKIQDKLVELLIEHGACIERIGTLLLYFAAYRANAHLAALLLQNGVDPNQQDDFCDISLHYVDMSKGVKSEDLHIKLDIIDCLLRHGADPWAVGRRGIPACVLHFQQAAGEEFESSMGVYLRYTEDLFTLNSPDESNFLSSWCFHCFPHYKQKANVLFSKVKFLLEQGTDLHNRGALGRNSLHVVLSLMFEFLLKDLELGSPDDWISLLREHVDESLVNTKDDFGWTPGNLIIFYTEMAIKKVINLNRWCTPVLAFFLEAGLDPTETDRHGASLLHHTAGTGLCDVLEKLINHRETIASVNQTDNNGSTPLHYAVVGYCNEATQNLLRNSSDKDARDCKGRTAWDLAKLFGCVTRILQTIDTGMKPISEAELVSVLKSPVFGLIEYQEDCFKREAQKVIDEVVQLVDMLSKLYNEQFPYFAFKPKLRGSMAEGTKSGPPNEFDFMLIMDSLTKYFVVTKMDFRRVNLSVAQPVNRGYPNIYLLTDGNKDDALCHFNVTFHAIILKSEIWKKTCLRFVHFQTMRVGANLVLEYNGFLHKHLTISIDLVPCFPLASDVKNPEIRWPVTLDFSKCKCYALFEKLNSRQQVSHSDYEEVLMNTLPKAAKEAYVVTKATCSRAGCPYNNTPSYKLKTSLLVSYARLLKNEKYIDRGSIAEWVRMILDSIDDELGQSVLEKLSRL